MADGFLESVTFEFRRYKTLGDRALAQVPDDDYRLALGIESNAIATLLKHVSGNLRSRWTDILTTDGEKADRDRDSEFVLTDDDTPERLRARWHAAWEIVFGELGRLTSPDLGRTVFIRGEPHSLVAAIHRSLAHTAYHVGQIIVIARHVVDEDWHSLSIPKGQSAAYTRRVRAEHAGDER